MNPPSDLARQLHAVLSGTRGITLLQLSHRVGLTVPEAYPAVRWLLKHGFIANRSLSRPFNQREAVYCRVKGVELPPTLKNVADRIRIRKQPCSKPPVGWEAACDLQACLKRWPKYKHDEYVAWLDGDAASGS